MTHSLHDHHLSIHLHILKSKTSRAVFAMTMRTFSAGLITLYLPLFLLDSGYTVTEVAYFFMATYILKTVSHKLVQKSVFKFGITHVLLSSYILAAIFAISLTMVGESTVWLLISVVTMMLMKVTYWDARHIDLAELFDATKMVRQTSLLFILNAVVAAISPLIGGYLSQSFDPGVTLMVAAASYLIGASILVQDWQQEREINVFQNEAKKPIGLLARDMFANFAMNLQSVTYFFVWPLYLFYLDLDFSQVGFVVSIGLAVGLLINWYFSVHSLNHISLFIKIGLIITVVFHALVPLASGVVSLVALSILKEVGASFYSSPYTALFYRNAREYGIVRYVTFVEMAGDIAKVLLWLPVLLLAAADPLMAIRLSFLIAAVATPFAYLMTNRDDTSRV